jgi:hypothetical protein
MKNSSYAKLSSAECSSTPPLNDCYDVIRMMSCFELVFLSSQMEHLSDDDRKVA